MITTTRAYHLGSPCLLVFRDGVEIARHPCKGYGSLYFVQGEKGVRVLKEDEIREIYEKQERIKY